MYDWKRWFAIAIALSLSASVAFAQCGPGGCPSSGRPKPEQGQYHRPRNGTQQPRDNPPKVRDNPTRPIGEYSSAVRINVRLPENSGAKGSGVLVSWGGRIVVLTARHVVAGAEEITVRVTTGAVLRARVLVTSPWDCAVLQLEGSTDGIEPSRLVTNEEAQFQRGDELRSCGFGGEEIFSVNRGRFLGFKRSSEEIDGSDDWMAITGQARQGDSGGPVYDRNGRVAGILWGSDDQNNRTICVQAGRLGIAMNEAMRTYVDPSN